MNAIRKQNVVIDKDNHFQVGDQIPIGKYTATCQKVTDRSFIFLLDQYLDKPYRMNEEWINKSDYEGSDLHKNLVSDFALDKEFDSIRSYLVPFKNGDIVRIPTVAEFFGHDDSSINIWFEMDDAEQWDLMKISSNRIAQRKGDEYEWGWLQNKVKGSAANFAYVSTNGSATDCAASLSLGVRPVFILVV